MYESTQDAAWVHGIDLAQEPDFDLGSLRVRPARCEVESAGVSKTLQRRVMQVLVALAQARGSVVSQNDLVARCWRGLSVSDDAIYRCISKLRKLAADYPDAPYAIEAIPGVGYRLTSSGAVGEADRNGWESPPDRRLRHRAFAGAAVLAVLLLAVAALWMVRGPVAEDHQADRVVVQPFETLTNSDDARALARRIPNEVVNELGDSQIDIVLADQAGKMPTIAASQTPGLIVAGILRNEGPGTIVNVRIEDGTSHAALWSMEFRRDRGGAADLPMEIAARVADVVNITTFARNANPPLKDDSALSALLQTNDMIRDWHGSDWAQTIERAQGVVARHPEFAFGHDVLAAAYSQASERIDTPDRARAMKEAARREANLTLKLDPADAGVYAILADLEPTYRSQEAMLLRGIKYGRHPKGAFGGVYSSEATLLSDVGRLREALSVQLIAHATDEWGPPKTAQLARVYAHMGNLPAARAWIGKAVQLWPNHSGVRRVQQYIVGFYQPPADGLALINALNANGSANDKEAAIWRRFIEARAAHSAQLDAAAIPKIRDAADRNEISRETEMMMMAELGGAAQAIDAANRALDQRQELRPQYLFTPITRNVRRDPRFVALADRMGLIEYWRETGKWPDFCADRSPECSPQLLAALKAH
jgi:DNA-binding winged helix-turn-helix (wHTH) protein/TolB-like protein